MITIPYTYQVLGFTVTYTDFPKKGEYLSLVSLSTVPPQVPLRHFYTLGQCYAGIHVSDKMIYQYSLKYVNDIPK